MSYDIPRHALEPPQCGWVSTMPFSAVHCAVNWSSVSDKTVVDVTPGSGETPPSHAVAGIGVSPFVVSLLAARALELAPEVPHAADATDSRPPSAAESSAWLAPTPVSLDHDTTPTIPHGGRTIFSKGRPKAAR